MKIIFVFSLLLLTQVICDVALPNKDNLDKFIREYQQLSDQAQLISLKYNDQYIWVSYKDGPADIDYKVKQNNDGFLIVGIEKRVSFSNPFISNSQDVSPEHKKTVQIQSLPPIPLIMPHFIITQNENIQSRNVFDVVEKEIKQMEQKMKSDKKHFQEVRNHKQSQFYKNNKKHFSKNNKHQILIGGGDHDFKWIENQQQPLIGGGDHDFKWIENQQRPLIGGGDHDYMSSEAKQPLIGGGDHDFKWIENQQRPLIGGGDHDYNIDKRHERRDHKQRSHHMRKEQKMHHCNKDWMNRQFNGQQVGPFLSQKVPDLMVGGQILLIQNKGFEQDKGFILTVQIKDKDGQIYDLEVYFRPRKQEMLVNSLRKINNQQSTIAIEQQAKEDQTMNMVSIPLSIESIPPQDKSQNMIPSSFIDEPQQSLLLGGKTDPDHNPEFMARAISVQFDEDNKQVQNDESLNIQTVSENVELVKQKSDEEKKSQSKIEQTGEKVDEKAKILEYVPLLGGETDADNQQDIVDEMVKSIIHYFSNGQSGVQQHSVSNHSHEQIKDIEEQPDQVDQKEIKVKIK